MEDLDVQVLKAIMDERDRRYEEKFIAQEKATSIALEEAEKAKDKADKEVVKWQAGANEWRGAMTDREKAFVQLIQFQTLEALVKTIQDDLKDSKSKRQGAFALWGAIVSSVFLAIAIITLIVLLI